MMFKKQFIDFEFKDTGEVINFNLRTDETSFSLFNENASFFKVFFDNKINCNFNFCNLKF